MIKKLIAFAAGLLFSASALANYVRYDFAPGSPVSGFFVQREDNQAIAWFSFHLTNLPTGGFAQFFPFSDDGEVLLTDATTHFIHHGPTNFSIYSNYGGNQRSSIDISFSRNAGGAYEYTAAYHISIWSILGWVDYAGTLDGSVTVGEMFPQWIEELDFYGGYFPGVPAIIPAYLGPSEVPEPASLALFAAGATAAMSIRRRRKVSGARI